MKENRKLSRNSQVSKLVKGFDWFSNQFDELKKEKKSS